MPSKRGRYRVKRHEVVQPLDKPYRLIPLTRNQTAIVDVEDFGRLSQWAWQAVWCPRTNSFYARRGERRKGKVYGFAMHREVLLCSRAEETDHVNHDTLDNRKQNLRRCTHAENMGNQRKLKQNRSGFKGVIRTKSGRWQARVKKYGILQNLGCFDSAEAAASAYDDAARKCFGEFAHLNFPIAART